MNWMEISPERLGDGSPIRIEIVENEYDLYW